MAHLLRNALKVSKSTKNQLAKSRKYSVIPENLSNHEETKVTKLASGLRVATQSGSSDLATVGVYIESGSAFENDSNNGVSNVLQHLAWKAPSRGSAQLSKDVESLGGNLTGFTSREQTGFVAQSFPGDVPKMVNVLAEVLQFQDLSESKIDEARNAALKEREAFGHNISNALFDHLHSAAFQGQPLALSVYGEAKSIKGLNSGSVRSFVNSNYTNQRVVVVGTGKVDHEQLVKLAESSFSLPSSVSLPHSSFVDIVGSSIVIRDDSMHDVHGFFAFPSVGYNHPHYWSMLVLQALVGSWDKNAGGGIHLSSRLAETFSGEKLGDSFQSFFTSYRNSGLFGVYAVGHEDHYDDLTYEIFNEFQKLGAYITPEELTRAKNKVKSAALSQLGGTLALSEDIGKQILFSGRHMSLKELFSRIDSVDQGDLRACLDTYFRDVDPIVAAAGRTEHLPDYGYMRSWTYWNRW